jgi:hypothetical protein
MPKYTIHMKSGAKKELPKDMYRRFKTRVNKGLIMEFPDGSLMNEQQGASWDFIDVEHGEDCTCEDRDYSKPMADAPTFEEVIERNKEDIKEVSGIPTAEEPQEEPDWSEALPILTWDEFKAMKDESGLSDAEFARKIEYSSATVRMAVKEGRITQPFSDKVREVFQG